MKKMQIFEPAMCCSTGLCGVGVNPELLRISTVLNTMNNINVTVERFNLTNSPMEFIDNKTVNAFINQTGIENLPITVLDGEIIIVGRYPTNEELTALLGLPDGLLTKQTVTVKPVKKSQGCGCNEEGC